MRPTYERARDTLRSIGLIRQILISGLLLTGAAASAEKVLPVARLPETSTVPLVAVLEVDPGCTVAHAVFVETVVYEDGGVVLEGRWPMPWARVREDANVVFEKTSLPSWARFTPDALEHLRQDVRELLEVSSDRERFGKVGIGVETHEVFVHAGNQFKQVTVMGYPNHGGVEKTDPSSLPRAVVRLLDATHDPSIHDRRPLLPGAFRLWVSPAEYDRSACEWPAAWPQPRKGMRRWPSTETFVELDGREWDRYLHFDRECKSLLFEPEFRLPGEDVWNSIRAREASAPVFEPPHH
jgi:hypothetical protein